MVEITEINCPICDKGKIKIVESFGYMTTKRNFSGSSVNVFKKGQLEILNDCSECGAKIREIKDKL